jgi:hypothetical protein
MTEELNQAEPSAPSAAPPGEREVMDAAAAQLAKSEDISRYAAEVADQKDYRDGKPEAQTSTRLSDRAERWREAIESAKAETDRAINGPDVSQPGSTAAQLEQFDQASQQEAERRQSEWTTAQSHLRFDLAEEQTPGLKEHVQTAFEIWPPSEAVLSRIAESKFGPQLASNLAENPDAIEALNKMSDRELDRIIATAEGGLIAQRQQPPPQQPQPHRETKAPAPIRPARGGAMPPKDLSALAKSEDISDFAQAFNARKKAMRSRA